MRLRSADVVAYGGAVIGARGAIEHWSERRGLLLRLVDADGLPAQGEASPLPRYSPDGFDAARDALVRFDWGALPDADAGETARAYLERLSPRLDGVPSSVRFAVETALLDRLGQRRGLPIWALLGASDRVEPVPTSLLVGGADDVGIVARAREAVERGFRTIKVKIAGPSLDGQIAVLEAVREKIAGAALRLDANGSLEDGTAIRELGRLAGVSPELVEEPVPRASLATLTAPPVPLALDESLQASGSLARLGPHLERLRVVAVVLKPAALGGFSGCLRLAEEARAAGLAVTVSHLFDGPVALSAAAHLALAVASRSRASGLGVHGGLRAWPEVPLPFLGPTSVIARDDPGLGLPALPEPA